MNNIVCTLGLPEAKNIVNEMAQYLCNTVVYATVEESLTVLVFEDEDELYAVLQKYNKSNILDVLLLCENTNGDVIVGTVSNIMGAYEIVSRIFTYEELQGYYKKVLDLHKDTVKFVALGGTDFFRKVLNYASKLFSKAAQSYTVTDVLEVLESQMEEYLCVTELGWKVDNSKVYKHTCSSEAQNVFDMANVLTEVAGLPSVYIVDLVHPNVSYAEYYQRLRFALKEKKLIGVSFRGKVLAKASLKSAFVYLINYMREHCRFSKDDLRRAGWVANVSENINDYIELNGLYMGIKGNRARNIIIMTRLAEAIPEILSYDIKFLFA